MITEKESLSEFLHRLVALKYHVHRVGHDSYAGYDLYQVDLSEWKLRFSDRSPLIHVKAKVARDMSAGELAESLQDTAREQEWRSRECLVLIDHNERGLKAQLAGNYFPRFVIIDAADQEKILAAQSTTAAMQDIILDQVSITDLCPYQTSGAVAGSRFFGRAAEVSRILRHSDLSFAIMGVRRIGKTSLLKEVERRVQSQGQDPARIVWMSCETINSLEQFMQEVVRELNIRELSHLQTHLASPWEHRFSYMDFFKRMAKMHGGPITIFLDEFDKLPGLLGNAQDPLPSLIRASMDGGYCRYIVAGFQTLIRELYKYDSSLFEAFEPMYLKPFTKKEAEETILRPLQSLRVRVEDEKGLVSRIYAETSGHPRLVQYYCLQLVKAMEREKSRTINHSMLEATYRSDGFRNEIISTFRENVNSADKLLVYAVLQTFPAGKDSYTREEMYGALKRQLCPSTIDEIDRSCERLSLAGILTRDEDKYKFSIPIFPKVIRAEGNLKYLLTITRKEAQS